MVIKKFVMEWMHQRLESGFSGDEQVLITRYIKMLNKKLRDYAFYKQSLVAGSTNSSEEITLNFTAEELQDVVTLMSQCRDLSKAKFFNALTEFALILLLPPKPLVNKTIVIDDYVVKMLQEESHQNLLFCSIMASTNLNAMNEILRQQKIEALLANMKDSEAFQVGQIIYNCSK